MYRYEISQTNGFHIPFITHKLHIDWKLLKRLKRSTSRCTTLLTEQLQKGITIHKAIVNCIISQLCTIKKKYRNRHLNYILDEFLQFFIYTYKPKCAISVRRLSRETYQSLLLYYTSGRSLNSVHIFEKILTSIDTLCVRIKAFDVDAVIPSCIYVPSLHDILLPDACIQDCHFLLFSDPYLPDGIFQSRKKPKVLFNTYHISDIYRLYCVFVHEYIPGHFWHWYKQGCFEQPDLVEGWACLTEKIFADISGTKYLHYVSLLMQLERYVVAIVDIGINSEYQWSYHTAQHFIMTGKIGSALLCPTFHGLHTTHEDIKRKITRVISIPGGSISYIYSSEDLQEKYTQLKKKQRNIKDILHCLFNNVVH